MSVFIDKFYYLISGLIIAFFVVLIDLSSKHLIFSFLENYSSYDHTQNYKIKITGFFNLVKVWNNGISFGMLKDTVNAKYFILTFNIGITIFLISWLYRIKNNYLMTAIGLIIGGAIGNIIDRIYNGAVADFIDLHYAGYHWPAFNVADSAIFVGVALLLLENLFCKKNNEEN